MTQQDYHYHFSRAEAEAIRAIQAASHPVAAIHEELCLRHTGRALAGLLEAGAERLRARRGR